MKIDKYYDAMAGNYIIPKNELTTDMFAEILEIIGKETLDFTVDKNCNIDEFTQGYMMFLWNNGEEDFWAITNWLV